MADVVKKPVAVAPAAAAEKKAEPVAAVKAAPVVEKKAAAKPAAKKPAAKKAAAKPAAKKAAAKPAAKKAAAKPAVKKAAAKPAAKKPATKKAAAKKVDTKANIVVQFDGADLFNADALKTRAVKDYKKQTKSDAKKIDIYVNVNEKKVYYVVDEFNGSFDI